MRVCINIQVQQWKPWHKRFNERFAKASRRLELVITGYYGDLSFPACQRQSSLLAQYHSKDHDVSSPD